MAFKRINFGVKKKPGEGWTFVCNGRVGAMA
jgi:hypothetical protein